MRGWHCCVISGLAAVLGCGPRAATDGEGETGEGGSSDSGLTDGGDAGMTGGDDGDGTTGGDDGSTGGGEHCPAGGMAQARFSVQTPGHEALAAECEVRTVTPTGNDVVMEIGCDTSPGLWLVLGVTADPPVDLSYLKDQIIELEYAVDMPFWEERWLAVRTLDPEPITRIYGVEAPLLEPSGGLDHPGLDVELREGFCPPGPGDCAMEERLAVDVGAEARIVDGHAASAGGYAVRVEFARKNLPPINCTDLPDQWVMMLAVHEG